ncbi:MAG TPA: tRNA uridine-5-carboxymethylaminomethyl(34) synthesis enzyme MnmG [Thermoanaerobaculia bacterium]
MRYDVLVIGGGHAGIEAGHAAARLGLSTALLTGDPAAIGRMSCNPAIGGLAKGQLVREIDALGGLMGSLADAAGIQFRILNRSRGPAVWGPRAQCDRAAYARLARERLRAAPNLTILEGMAEELLEEGGRAVGAITARGERIRARAVVVTTGTFLNGLMHTGERRTEGGRVGEAPAKGLSAALARLGLRLGRFKTGTPPRLHRDTIDYAQCSVQEGDEPPVPFSFRTASAALPRRQAVCWLTATNARVHDRIRENLHRSPMYSGRIQGIGPRYCPSIEDKVVKFADKSEHTIFLEPDGWDAEEIYVNGLSTSLPEDVQREVLAGIRGLARARMIRPGYAVEYDFVFPEQLRLSLEALDLPGLFLAGQINGTSGYEEAAAQGLCAGINAARAVRGEEPFVLERSEAYTAVMIDDLTKKGLDEPYRLFTSRAEYRLLLGVDSVLGRLAPHGRRLGLLDEAEYAAAMRSEGRLREAEETLRGRVVTPSRETLAVLEEAVGIRVAEPTSLYKLLQRRDLEADRVLTAFAPEVFAALSREEIGALLSRVRYDGYIRRELERIERLRPFESRTIPAGFAYAEIPGLSREVVEKCARRRPATVGEAARIPGVTPAAVAIISAHVAKGTGAASSGAIPGAPGR